MSARKVDPKPLTDPQTVEELGLALRWVRLEMNLSQTELASRAGLYRSAIVRLETGETSTLLSLVLVLRALDHMHLLAPFHEKLRSVPTVVARRNGLRFKKERERATRKNPKAKAAARTRKG